MTVPVVDLALGAPRRSARLASAWPRGKAAVARLAAETDPFELGLGLSLLLLVLYVDGAWYAELPTKILALSALVWPPLRRLGTLWYALGCWLVACAAERWAQADNHQYLIGYLALAIGLALSSESPREVMRKSARALIGLCFLFAVIWKVISPDFANGAFFHYTLLTDDRFAHVAAALGGVAAETKNDNETAVRALSSPVHPLDRVVLSSTAPLRRLALFMAIWTLAIEGLVALAFLAPARFRLARARDGILLVFVASTYLLAPVVGFGWSILILGLFQVDEHRSWARWAYPLVFLVLQVYLLPWRGLIAPSLGL